MNPSVLRQVLAVYRMELRKAFFARRGLWVYLLALLPVLLFAANSLYAPRERARLAGIAAAHPTAPGALAAVSIGADRAALVRQFGEPYDRRSDRRRIGPDRTMERDVFSYTDGQADFRFYFNNARLNRIERTEPLGLPQLSLIFASVFQVYFLRLAVFFGCVGIFMNLIRGELLDKSLHFYLLAPIPREWMLAGKFLAGLTAAVVIFVGSTALQLAAMFWQFDHATVTAFLGAAGWSQQMSYLGVAAVACVGYGSVFLLAGLLFPNPIVPATGMLLWESVNLFVPATLKKLSLIFYLQSLCPVVPPPDATLPPALVALISPAEPAGAALALLVVACLSVVLLGIAARRAHRLEINYSSE